jgi:pilus assembly protein Flp/PilA
VLCAAAIRSSARARPQGAVGLHAALLEEAMKNFALKLRRFLVSEDGPTAVEYAVMLALIIVVCLTAIQAVGTNAASTFNTVAGQIGTTGT